LVRTSVEYKNQAFLNQKLLVYVRMAVVTRILLISEYLIIDKKSQRIIATGMASNVLINREKFKPVRIPKELLLRIEALEGKMPPRQ